MTKRGCEESFYNRCHRVRDAVSRRWQAEKIAHALTHYTDRDLSSCVCLDVGCSSGVITSAIAPIFRRTVGLEYDETALRAADSAVRAGLALLRGDGMSLPFSDGMIDVIICAQVYEHVPDDARLFAEIYRVLRPGGLVFFSGPNWLFPIEPHHMLPLLHWLPRPLADLYLRLTHRGDRYYEHLRHIWGLRRVARAFTIQDVTVAQLQRFYLSSGRYGFLRRVPGAVWMALLPLLPTFNWILHKPQERPER